MPGNRFLVLSLCLAAFWFNNGQNQAQASAILQDDVKVLKTQLTQLVQRLDLQERRNLQLEEKLQQQKEEFSTQLQQQKDDFTFQLQHQAKVNEQQWEDFLAKQTKPAGVQRKSGADRKSKTEASVRNNTLHKRSDDLGPVVSHVSQQVTELTADIQSLKNVNVEQDTHITAASSTSYIRWGHTSCPASAELIYSGIIGGTLYHAPGGPANHLCLTTQPIYDGHHIPGGHPHSYLYGSEYDICPESECNLTPACAGCKISRTTAIMIPGTNVCPSGWTVEYSGHVMGGFQGPPGGTEYLCVDSTLGYIHGNNTNDNQNTLHYVVSKCGALPCPPYVDEKILTCIVCSK